LHLRNTGSRPALQCCFNGYPCSLRERYGGPGQGEPKPDVAPVNRIDHGRIYKVASEAGGDHSESYAPLDSPSAKRKPRASIQRQKRESQVRQHTQNPGFVKELEI